MMHKKIWILLLLGLMVTGFLLWQNARQVDLAMGAKWQAAEEKRAQMVISHDFDYLKAELITVHRDYWLLRQREEQQARIEAGCLLGLVLLMGIGAWQLVRHGRRPQA